jgi:uncharacterized protein YutE (UPF0331/DUF86 family)
MTPRAPDPDVIRQRLDAMRRTLETLASVETPDADTLRAEPVLRAAVERLVSRLVDLAVEVNAHVASTELGRAPGDYRESFELAAEAGVLPADLAASLRSSVGLRNVIVHEYLELDLGRLAAAVPLALDGYGRFISAVARWAIDPDAPRA